MYGLLLQAALEFITTKYNQEVARDVLEMAEGSEGSQKTNESDLTASSSSRSARAGFSIHQIYSQKFLVRIAECLSERVNITIEQAMEQMGQFFVRFVRQGGYDIYLKMLGRTFRDFVGGLDSLHEYFKASYPKIKAPSFVVLEEDADGMLIRHRSVRPGLHFYVIGQLKEAAKAFFNLQISAKVVSLTEDARGRYVSTIRLIFDNSNHNREDETSLIVEDVASKSLKADFFFDFNPFFVALNSDLEILSIGKALKNVMPTSIGSDFTESFEITRPSIAPTWENIIDHTSSVFEVQSIKAIEQHEEDEAVADDIVITIRLRGQMVHLEDWNCIFFTAMPMIEDLPDLRRLGLKIHDLSMSDSSREFLEAKQANDSTLDPLLVQEAKTGGKLEQLSKDATVFKMKRIALLEVSVPRYLLRQVSSMGKTMKAEDVSAMVCTFSLMSSQANIQMSPKDYVSNVNKLLARFENIVSKYASTQLYTGVNENIVLFGLPLLSHLPANFAILVATEIIEMAKAFGTDWSGKTTTAFQPEAMIGIDYGAVMGAVIGVRMPRYVVVGQTATIAVRLSRDAKGNEITVSESMAAMLQANEFAEGYNIEPLHDVTFHDLPHLPMIKTYRVERANKGKKMTKSERKVRMAANRGVLDGYEIESSRASSRASHSQRTSTRMSSGSSVTITVNTADGKQEEYIDEYEEDEKTSTLSNILSIFTQCSRK